METPFGFGRVAFLIGAAPHTLAMTYLSRIALPVSRETLTSLAGLDSSHKLVMGLFPDLEGSMDSPRAGLGILFRVEMPQSLIGVEEIPLLVQSQVPVDDSSKVLRPLEDGDNILISATVSAETRHHEHGRKLLKDDQAEESLKQKFADIGIELTDVSVSPNRRIGARDKSVTGPAFNTRKVEGRATVLDAKFANVGVANGIGRGKNYGLGMVSYAIIGR